MVSPCVARTLAGAALLSAVSGAIAQALPAEAETALRRAKVPPAGLAVVVQDAQTGQRLLAWNDHLPMNPASVFKLLTTYAALDQLGPAFSWATPVYLTGPLHDGVLDGSVVIQGSGDPKLVLERVWLLLRRLQQMGIHEIRGDIVLDRSAFSLPTKSPADFDGEASRPYNVQPDALLLNHKSLNLVFMPAPGRGVATVVAEPPLSGVRVDATVPLTAGACGDWRAGLKATLADVTQIHFAGAFPVSCGDKSWPVAYADPASYNARLVEQLWRDMGGLLTGSVRDGLAPRDARPAFESTSPPLAEVVRDINKFSNNVMAEQLFLTLGARQRGMADGPGRGPAAVPGTDPLVLALGNGSPPPRPDPASPGPLATLSPGAVAGADSPSPAAANSRDAARDSLRRWVRERWGEMAARELVVDNGSGLSREARVSADLLARLLQAAFSSAVMSELMSSLPVSGLDGTLRRSTAAQGRAHLKTGSLRDVAAVAGYVLSNSGRRYVLVAIVNHENAGAARPALDALVQWAIDDAPTR